MDLTGKWISTWMTRAQALQAIVGSSETAPAASPPVLLGGRIAGESPVGLWIEVDVLHDVGGSEIIEGITSVVRPRLVRWDFITNAALFSDRPNESDAVGFRPR